MYDIQNAQEHYEHGVKLKEKFPLALFSALFQNPHNSRW